MSPNQFTYIHQMLLAFCLSTPISAANPSVSAIHSTADTKTFYFGEAKPAAGSVAVEFDTAYSPDLGYGWVSSNSFMAEIPEGNYIVTVQYTDAQTAASATVKSEARRLMVMKQDKPTTTARQFAVNVRRPEIDRNRSVRLNHRETSPLSAHWDNNLTLEFLPAADAVQSVTLSSTQDVVTIYIAGDSTVTDQRSEPWAGWGQCLPRFFGPNVAVANHAESGRALYSFLWENRLDKILSTIRPGDYLLIQFGHNDQKDKRDDAGPYTSYKADLETFVNKIRSKRAQPILITPMERRRWSDGQPAETLTEYAEAVRHVGQQQNVPVIDLHTMSLQFYAALGERGSKNAFVHYPANSFPGQDQPFKDDTHHNVYGAYELSRCVVRGIQESVPSLARHLRDDAGNFDPSKPDAPSDLEIPPSVATQTRSPEGN